MNVPYKAGSTSVRAFFLNNKQFNATVGECGLAPIFKKKSGTSDSQRYSLLTLSK